MTACRCLFGAPDPKENIRKLTEELQIHYQKFTDRWNFDPENNTVWSGRYQWSVVENLTDNNNEQTVVKCSGPIRNKVSDRGSNHPYLQTRITDFLRSRRSLPSTTRKSTSVDKSSPEKIIESPVTVTLQNIS